MHVLRVCAALRLRDLHGALPYTRAVRDAFLVQAQGDCAYADEPHLISSAGGGATRMFT